MIDLKKTEEMEYKFKDIIEGEFITLKKVTLEDASDIFSWRTSKSGRYLRQPKTYTIDTQVSWIKSRSVSEINYIIYSNEAKEKVGMIGIYDVNFNDKVANVGRLFLAEQYLHQSTPFGLEALLILYDFVINKMNFEKITGDILAANTEMVKLQKFLGMEQEGFLKKHVVIRNNREDIHVMSLFREDIEGYKKKISWLLNSFRK